MTALIITAVIIGVPLALCLWWSIALAIADRRDARRAAAETAPYERVTAPLDAVVVDDPDVLAENRIVLDAFDALRRADKDPR